MCGIVGIWNSEKDEISYRDLVSMLQSQKHRGPHGQGVTVWGSEKRKDHPYCWKGAGTPPPDVQIRLRLGLGHNLLSIQDSEENSRQPMVSGSGRYWLAYNGEIYNFIELRDQLIHRGVHFKTNSDTEVLLALWEFHGTESINRLRGMFAFLLYDTYENTLFAVRDRFGIKPLYYAPFPGGKGIALASEIHTFYVSQRFTKSCRDDALLGFLSGAVNKPDDTDTIYAGIQEIPPGNFLIVKDHKLQIKEYYKPASLQSSHNREFWTEAQAIEDLKDLFIESVKIHLRSTREVGTCMSGGLDSTNIAYAIKSILGDRINDFKAFTIGNNQSLDSLLSASAAEQLSLYHRSFDSPSIIQDGDIIDMIQTCEVPNHTWGPINQYYLMGRIKEANGIQVLLDGQGGDEVFSGYPWFFVPVYRHLLEKGDSANAEKIKELYYRNPPLPPWILDHATQFYFSREYWISSFEGGALGVLGLTKQDALKLRSIRYYLNDELSWQEFYQHELYRRELQHLLRQEDRLGMRFSIENRVPFLDHKLVEHVSALPAEFLWNKGLFKYPLRRLFREMPGEIRNNVIKKGFWESHSSLSDSFRNTMIETVSESKILKPYIKKRDRIRNMTDLSLWRFFQIDVLFGN